MEASSSDSHLRKQWPDIWALLYMAGKHRLQLLLIPSAGPRWFGYYIYLIVGAYRLQKTKRAAHIESSSNHLQKREVDIKVRVTSLTQRGFCETTLGQNTMFHVKYRHSTVESNTETGIS